MALPMSVLYPAKVIFYTADPSALLEAGYDSLRIEKRATRASPWVPVTNAGVNLVLEEERWNYHFVDETSAVGNEYRAILQNKTTPGTPVDVPQPPVRAVETSFEMIMTVQEFRDIYLWGQDPAFIAEDGRAQPEYTYVHNILYGIAKVERALDLKLLPVRVVEQHDYNPGAFARGEYLMLPLDEFPVLSIESLTEKFPGQTERVFPASWLRYSPDDGLVHVVPDGTPMGGSSSNTSRRSFVPGAYEVAYMAGFDLTRFPHDLKEVIGKEAAFGPLNVGGDLVGGAGLAGTSISMDGLSQSVTTTNSSTNAGFGARLIQYEKELKNAYKVLRPFYKGVRLGVA